jgi:hypothetical protein
VAAPPPPPPPPPPPEGDWAAPAFAFEDDETQEEQPAPAAALIAPVEVEADTPTEADGPVELAPQSASARVAPVRKTVRQQNLRPGDLICGECGTGNDPARKFCARCGHPLAGAQTVRTPWWRRLFRRRGPKVLKAGSRPRKPGKAPSRSVPRQVLRKLRTVLAVLIVLGGILYGAYPPLRTYLNDQVLSAKQQLFGFASGQLKPIRPTATTANVQLPQHTAQMATDEFTNTYWDAPWSGPGATNVPALTLNFGKNVILQQIVIYIGASDNYTAHDRPALLEFSYSNQENDFINLQDTSGKQQITLHHGVGVSSVQIKVLDVFPAQNSADVAVTEIELFGL